MIINSMAASAAKRPVDRVQRCALTALLLAAATLVAGPGARAADPLRAAVFPFELDDTSLQGEREGANPQDQGRRAMLDAQLLTLLAASGRYAPMGVPADVSLPTLRTCDGCEVAAARKVDAAVSVIGWIQKVSNLILNINLVVRDASTGRRLAAGSVDIRGNTDEAWTRGLSYLVRNRILVAEPGR